MAEIENPRHSRPIDVHRWSEHPEVKALVEEIWIDYLPPQLTGEAGEKRTGPKPKASFKNQLRVLILDLYVAWLEDPTLSIGMSMSPNEWKANSRYNALHLSKKLIPITEALVIAGLVDISKGSYAGPGAKTNRTTRIRASEGLQDMFQGAQFRREDIHTFSEQEVIILRDEKVLGKVGKQLEYEDTADTIRMRQELRDYNDLLAASFIDIATLQAPEIPKGESDNTSLPVRIQPETCRLRRVFSRGNWSMNGRFYGGWWQQVNDEWRSKIFIDDQPTIEVDFKGLHVAMLYPLRRLHGSPLHIPINIGPPYLSGSQGRCRARCEVRRV